MTVESSPGWRDYWKENRPASCVPENPDTAQQIAVTWQRWFADYASGSRMLDIATGNGIVLSYAAAAARANGCSFALTGVDLADIDPLRHVANLDADLRSASFLGGVAAEQLPFAAQSFDVVVSQYGLEYADLDSALTEVARVLASGGSLLWLAHSDSSEVVQQHRDQALEVDYLLAPRGPVYFMNTFVARQRRQKDMQYSVKMLNESFAAAEEFCRAHPPAKVVQEVCGGFAEIANRWQAYNAGDLAKMMEEAERRLVAHRYRIQSLLAAAMTPQRMETVRARLAQPHWNDLSISELRVGVSQSEIGICIRARRADL